MVNGKLIGSLFGMALLAVAGGSQAAMAEAEAEPEAGLEAGVEGHTVADASSQTVGSADDIIPADVEELTSDVTGDVAGDVTGDDGPVEAESLRSDFVTAEGYNSMKLDKGLEIAELSDFYFGGYIDLLSPGGARPEIDEEDESTPDDNRSGPPATGPVGLEGLPTAAELLDFSDPDQQEFCGTLSCMFTELDAVSRDPLVVDDMPRGAAARERSRAGGGPTVRFESNSELADRLIGLMSWFKAKLRSPPVIILVVLGLGISALLGRKTGRSERI